MLSKADFKYFLKAKLKSFPDFIPWKYETQNVLRTLNFDNQNVDENSVGNENDLHAYQTHKPNNINITTMVPPFIPDRLRTKTSKEIVSCHLDTHKWQQNSPS